MEFIEQIPTVEKDSTEPGKTLLIAHTSNKVLQPVQ